MNQNQYMDRENEFVQVIKQKAGVILEDLD